MAPAAPPSAPRRGHFPSLASPLTAPGPWRRGAPAAGTSPGAAEPPTRGVPSRCGDARPVSHRRPGGGVTAAASAREDATRPGGPRPGGQGTGWARGAAEAFKVPQARRGSPAAPPRAESATRRARGPLAHAQCTAHAQVPQIHSRVCGRRRRRGWPSRRGPRGNGVLGGELGSQPREGRREASETSVDTLLAVNEAVVGSSPTSRCLGVNVAS